MSTSGSSKPSIKVTDKRLFTEEGDLRDDSFLTGAEEPARTDGGASHAQAEQRAPELSPEEEDLDPENPGTPFTSFLDSLIVNAYMALGMVRHPLRNEAEIDVHTARQMIEILEMLGEKTKGNLTRAEAAYLKAHLGELKLAFVRRSQSI